MSNGGRAFKILGYLMANPEMNFTAVAEQFNCTREYVSQIEAIARQEGIIK
jgi:DNA-binding IscR family transcriptional regulator